MSALALIGLGGGEIRSGLIGGSDCSCWTRVKVAKQPAAPGRAPVSAQSRTWRRTWTGVNAVPSPSRLPSTTPLKPLRCDNNITSPNGSIRAASGRSRSQEPAGVASRSAGGGPGRACGFDRLINQPFFFRKSADTHGEGGAFCCPKQVCVFLNPRVFRRLISLKLHFY